MSICCLPVLLFWCFYEWICSCAQVRGCTLWGKVSVLVCTIFWCSCDTFFYLHRVNILPALSRDSWDRLSCLCSKLHTLTEQVLYLCILISHYWSLSNNKCDEDSGSVRTLVCPDGSGKVISFLIKELTIVSLRNSIQGNVMMWITEIRINSKSYSCFFSLMFYCRYGFCVTWFILNGGCQN